MAYEQEMGMKEMKAPGVYIVELQASPVSVQSIPTSVPAFIGYTPRAEDFCGRDCVNRVIRITSYDEFAAMFLPENASGFPTQFAVLPRSDVSGKTPELVLNGESFAVTPDPDTVYYMVASVRMFFQNGGSTAYIISLGSYGPASGKYQQRADLPVVNNNVNKEAYLQAITSLDREYEPAMCVMPDAVLLDNEAYAEVMNAALTMAERTNRFVCLLDIACGLSPDPADHISEVENFRNNLPNSSGYREALSSALATFHICVQRRQQICTGFPAHICR
jgi:phage tail sheath protein FI